MSTPYSIERLFLEYSDDLHNYLVYYTGSPDVEDLLQEVFIKVIRFNHTYNGKASLKSWLFAIARNEAKDFYRRQKRVQWVPVRVLDFLHIHHETPDKLLEKKDQSYWLLKKIHELKPSYRDVVLMRFILELSISETAFALNWSESKVTSTYRRAFQKLKEMIHDDREREVI